MCIFTTRALFISVGVSNNSVGRQGYPKSDANVPSPSLRSMYFNIVSIFSSPTWSAMLFIFVLPSLYTSLLPDSTC